MQAFERNSVSLTIRETETTIGCRYTPIRMAKIKNKTILKIPRAGKNVEQLKNSHTLPVGIQNGTVTLCKFYKVKHTLIYDSLLGVYPRKIKIHVYTKTCL